MNKPNWKRRAYYGITIATMLAMTAGFAIATVQLGQTNTNYQGSQTTTVSSVTGLTWTSTVLAVASATTSTSCAKLTPCDVTSTPSTICVSGTCAGTDFVEQITMTTVSGVAFPTSPIAITVYVTIGSATAGTTGYYSETGTPGTAVNIVQMYDIGTAASGPSDVTAVNIIVTS